MDENSVFISYQEKLLLVVSPEDVHRRSQGQAECTFYPRCRVLVQSPAVMLPCVFSLLILGPLSARGQFGGGCLEANGKFADATQCDAYLECKDGASSRKLCPDGLVFSFSKRQYAYPCVYPAEEDCSGRATLQPAQPSGDCPHQFGLYKLGDAANCGQFLSCANGKGYIFDCPEGLAFSEEIARCDWPDLVPSCNPQAFLNFVCPPSPNTYEEYTYHRSPAFCEKFFICINGKPRLFVCGKGKAFSIITNTCESAENVTDCYTSGSNPRFQQYQLADNGYSSDNYY